MRLSEDDRNSCGFTPNLARKIFAKWLKLEYPTEKAASVTFTRRSHKSCRAVSRR